MHQAKAQTQLSLSEKELAFDDNYPRIMGVAGYVQDTWAGVPLSNYAVAVGIVIPFFLRNLTRTQNQLKIAEFDFLLSSAEKAIVNGGIENFLNSAPAVRLKNKKD